MLDESTSCLLIAGLFIYVLLAESRSRANNLVAMSALHGDFYLKLNGTTWNSTPEALSGNPVQQGYRKKDSLIPPPLRCD
jgi:hypothetical protein